MKKQAGFSLLEVMVVLVIIGFIVAMVAPNIIGNQEEAAKQKTVVDIKGLENALTAYKVQNGFYPTTEQGLEALVQKATSEPVPRKFPDGGFLSTSYLPKDPWGNDYQLLSPGEKGRIDIFSMGPDRVAGTEDDIGNWNMEENQ